MSRESHLAELAAHGIDPDDPKYVVLDSPHTFLSGDDWCPWCHQHSTRCPRVRCDLQQAKAAQMAADGPAAPCFICHQPFHGERGNLCPACIERAEVRKFRRWRGPRFSRSVRRDDGLGCVDRVSRTELAMERRDGEQSR